MWESESLLSTVAKALRQLQREVEAEQRVDFVAKELVGLADQIDKYLDRVLEMIESQRPNDEEEGQ